jgi:ABC-2 type transport system ATP-binding protein
MVAGIYRMDCAAAGRRIGALLEEFQLAGAARRRVNAYSRGMKQRLGLAAVMLTEPELLILDEPVSALDPEGRYKVLELIASLRGKATVFFSSHILADVERVCDRVAIIDRGIKLMENDTREILAGYAMEQYLVGVAPRDKDKALALLRGLEAVRQVEPSEEALLVTSKPGRADELAEAVLPLLVKEGVAVTGFMRRRVDLEEVFFKVLHQNGPGGGERQ